MKAFLGGLALMLGALTLPAQAGDKATPDEAVAMVKKAVAMVKSDGKDKTLAAIGDPANKDFHDRDLYVYVYDLNGVSLAHGTNPKMVGKSLLDMRDVEGKPMIQEMVKVVKEKGSGWVDYKFPNPATKAVEGKSGYVERVGDFFIGSGVYK
ncbi:histidine kinase [Duganella sp. FT92W]|uniref:Histidine kinase n=1 Tax=Pseudoduganella rivuli TaxID=2666085 RepID=A0A7X2IT22_9BURK|nr:cache domain-containing protein [Pseudoduganella rivuli]MRV75581.1 histidine kinase [Pseudoduganella rivuli]